jgi:anti-sigma regulatory factor (Ser/Thr protein kinase)
MSEIPQAEASLRDFRAEVLRENGADATIVDELLAYNENRFDAARARSLQLPLGDEPHLSDWSEYAAEAARLGVIPALTRRFVQLLFPVREGISQTAEYRAASRRGERPARESRPEFLQPDGISLELYATVAGRIPILVAGEREDFETLVRVFSGRNEPIPVPESMGACIVTGLNNWDRVARYRQRFEAESGGGVDEGAWLAEFQKLVPQRELYQDRFIILSTGPYSAVPGSEIGRAEAEWLQESLAIRRAHESTHYFTCRVFGSMRNNLLDEIIADFAGLHDTFAAYDGGLALRFFGLEDFPRYRPGGRLQSYLGDPPLSPEAVTVLRSLVHRAVRNIEAFASIHEALRARDAVARMVVALTGMTLEELASSEMAGRTSDLLEPGDESVALSVAGNHEGIEQLLREVQAFAGRHASLASVQADLGVVLDEVVSNIVKYGYGSGPTRPVDVGLRLEDDVLRVEIADEAASFDPLARPRPDTDQSIEERPIGGLGIHLVRQLMDDVRYRREAGRNILTLTKRL